MKRNNASPNKRSGDLEAAAKTTVATTTVGKKQLKGKSSTMVL